VAVDRVLVGHKGIVCLVVAAGAEGSRYACRMCDLVTTLGDATLTLPQENADAGADASGLAQKPDSLSVDGSPPAVAVSESSPDPMAGTARLESGTAEGTATVTVADARLASQQELPSRRGRHAAERSRQPVSPVSAVTMIAATGLLLVAFAYTAGRLGHVSSPWANRAYWAGQAFILVPTAASLLGRRVLTASETVAVITVLTVAEYFAWICYSPAAFTYPDELEHWRSTVNVLQTGGLSGANYLLPISPHYPGLEEVTSALVSVTGLSLFTSGLIVAGIAHLLFIYVLFLLFREISGSHRVAGVAVLLYASNLHFASFDSMFIYQTLALPFLGLTLLAAWRLASKPPAEPRVGWLILAVLAIIVTVATHHVTSYVLVAALVLITVAALLTANWRMAAWTAVLAVLSATATVCWLVFAAPETWTYLQPFADESLQSFRDLLAGGGADVVPISAGPLADRMLSDIAVLAVSALLPVGWWQVWRRLRHQPWTVALAIGSIGWYATVAIRLAAADGSELAGRAATFVFVPAAYIAALAVGHLASAVVRRHARAVAAAVLVVVLMLLFDGLANGWPPYWERLPGSFQVAGSERSVEPEVIAAAEWTLKALGHGNRIATDVGSYPVLGSYGDQDPVRDVAYLYTSSVYTLADASRAKLQALRYIWVDQRLSQSLPASGQYFPVDPDAGKYKHPLPAADLTKFNTQPGIDRIYDSGNIVIYQLPGASHGP